MNNFSNQNWNNQQNNQNNQQQTGFNQQSNQSQTGNNQTQQNQQSNNQTPGLMQTLLNATLPALMQHFTGQQMAMGGSNGNSPEIQLMLSQILMLQNQIITSQQDFNQRLVNLEISASQQLNNISQQVQNIRSVRLSHSKETKSVDYNLQQENDPNKY